MTSVVEICNLALGNVRAGSINDINESSLQAQQCKLRYAILRDKCLKETNWNFARKIIALAPVTDEIFTQPYSYRYPNDCLKIERLVSPSEQLTADGTGRYYYRDGMNSISFPPIPYEIYNVGDKKIIGTVQPDLRIDYTVNVVDPNLFSAEFILALSHLIASEIAIPIIGAKDGRLLRSDSLTIYRTYLNSGIAIDNSEKRYEPVESEFVSCRG